MDANLNITASLDIFPLTEHPFQFTNNYARLNWLHFGMSNTTLYRNYVLENMEVDFSFTHQVHATHTHKKNRRMKNCT